MIVGRDRRHRPDLQDRQLVLLLGTPAQLDRKLDLDRAREPRLPDSPTAVVAQMWQGRAQPRFRCGRDGPTEPIRRINDMICARSSASPRRICGNVISVISLSSSLVLASKLD